MRKETMASKVSSTAFVFLGAAVAVLLVLRWFGVIWQDSEDAVIAAGVVGALSGRAAWIVLNQSPDEFGPAVNAWLAGCKLGGIVVSVGYTVAWTLGPVLA